VVWLAAGHDGGAAGHDGGATGHDCGAAGHDGSPARGLKKFPAGKLEGPIT
jgi:hypothetical protein